ncbi:pentapeptide repeat-containing protein [Burkholderia pseudomallei]|uniref:pentapeptide repeat-containing protein n=1 Tax=Burkholderia pseudomallei TaxID=28450 RepID=UPI00387DD2BC
MPRARPRRLGGARWRGARWRGARLHGARLHGARNQHDPRGAGRGCVAGVGWDGHLQCRDESESSRTR